MELTDYLKILVQHDGSDLYLTVNAPPAAKFHGQLKPLENIKLTNERLKEIANSIMDDDQRAQFEHVPEMNLAIAESGVGRFRVNIFKQRNSYALVIRNIKVDIPNADDLGLPSILKEKIMEKRGLILFVGGTGSGKSTSLAALIDHRNSNSSGHIITIEDPIEYVHPHKKSLVNQREVGVDTLSYHNALRSSLREAPDVILIGEVRDRETMEAALELCNTGHLCISTLHANNANQAMERIINLFPQDLHKQLFLDLSLNVRAVISQRLVTGIDGRRVAAIEIMISTPHIADLILKGNLSEIKAAMESSGAKGMQTFDMALYSLYKDERITLEEALNNADSRTNLEAKINFG